MRKINVIIVIAGISILTLIMYLTYVSNLRYGIDEDETVAYIDVDYPIDTLEKYVKILSECSPEYKVPLKWRNIAVERIESENQNVIYFGSEIEEMYLITFYITPQITRVYNPLKGESWLMGQQLNGFEKNRVRDRFRNLINYIKLNKDKLEGLCRK
jgi:hypothetical protein